MRIERTFEMKQKGFAIIFKGPFSCQKLSQTWECAFKPFVFQKVPIWQWLLVNQIGRFEYNFRCLKRFSRKLPENCDWLFFLIFFTRLQFYIDFFFNIKTQISSYKVLNSSMLISCNHHVTVSFIDISIDGSTALQTQ